jgi:EAL domain-containing protein (putative c-di-GMP-specific phosphodiesterase class I)
MHEKLVAERVANTGVVLNASVWFFSGQVEATEPVRNVGVHAFPFRVGRRADLELSLPIASVSKEHAEIFERDGDLWVRDAGSTNGTYVNGERVETEALIKEGDIVQFATVVFRVGRESRADDGGTIQEETCDRALAMMQFDRLISDGGVVPFFQPIVDLAEKNIVGFESLGRSRLFGLTTPAEMFAAASALSLEAKLSRIFRDRGVEVAQKLPENQNIFVNTHPIELSEGDILESLRKLRAKNPGRMITLEIHEAAITAPDQIRALRDELCQLEMQLAFDDFGAGRARLVELSEVQPDYLKFDIKLIKDIHLSPASRQEVVAALVRMVNDLGIISLAEGVESKGEHEVLKQMGFKFGQGYLYAKPAPISRCLDLVRNHGC